MKKFYLAILCAMLAFGAAVAQDTANLKNEISLGFGLPQNASNTLESFANGFSGGSNRDMDKDHFFGPYSIEYYYHVTPLIGVGGIGSVNYFNGVDMGTVPREHVSTYLTILPGVKFNWLRRAKWGLYSKLALGYTHGFCKVRDKDTGANEVKDDLNLFNFQASLIGVEFGGRKVRGFVEMGFGEQGWGMAGIRMRF